MLIITAILASTITTTLSNGQTTVVGSVIYQYGNNDNVGGNQGNNNFSPTPGSPAPSSPTSKSSAVRQVADSLRSAGGWGWGFFAWFTTAMVVAA
jgi:hypothetical protein